LFPDEKSKLQYEYKPELPGGVTVIKGKAYRAGEIRDDRYILQDRQTISL